jgi:hypothetical protein
MDDMRVSDSGDYALRVTLKSWFGQKEPAVKEYAALSPKVDPGKDYGYLNPRCLYGIDIDRKLKIAHSKLSRAGFIA